MKKFSILAIIAIVIVGVAIFLGSRNERSLNDMESTSRSMSRDAEQTKQEATKAIEREMNKMEHIDDETAVARQRRRAGEAMGKLGEVHQGGGGFNASNPAKFLEYCLGKPLLSDRSGCLSVARGKFPNDARILYHLGITYHSLGEREKAIGVYNRLKTINYGLADELALVIGQP